VFDFNVCARFFTSCHWVFRPRDPSGDSFSLFLSEAFSDVFFPFFPLHPFIRNRPLGFFFFFRLRTFFFLILHFSFCHVTAFFSHFPPTIDEKTCDWSDLHGDALSTRVNYSFLPTLFPRPVRVPRLLAFDRSYCFALFSFLLS